MDDIVVNQKPETVELCQSQVFLFHSKKTQGKKLVWKQSEMKQTIPRTWEVLRIDGIDAKSFFIFVFWVVNEDENFSFSWELLWCEAKTDTVRFSGTNLADSNTTYGEIGYTNIQ